MAFRMLSCFQHSSCCLGWRSSAPHAARSPPWYPWYFSPSHSAWWPEALPILKQTLSEIKQHGLWKMQPALTKMHFGFLWNVGAVGWRWGHVGATSIHFVQYLFSVVGRLREARRGRKAWTEWIVRALPGYLCLLDSWRWSKASRGVSLYYPRWVVLICFNDVFIIPYLLPNGDKNIWNDRPEPMMSMTLTIFDRSLAPTEPKVKAIQRPGCCSIPWTKFVSLDATCSHHAGAAHVRSRTVHVINWMPASSLWIFCAKKCCSGEIQLKAGDPKKRPSMIRFSEQEFKAGDSWECSASYMIIMNL